LQVNFSTSGGYDGTALCSFIYQSYTIPLESTGGSQHSQNFEVSQGEFDESFICQDIIGSSVEKDIRSIINIRNTAPMVTRTYTVGGTLFISTDEPSTCYYSNDNSNACWFDMSNGTEMTGTNMNSHTTSFDSKQTYYIKCIDSFGHYTGQCNAIVKDGKYES